MAIGIRHEFDNPRPRRGSAEVLRLPSRSSASCVSAPSMRGGRTPHKPHSGKPQTSHESLAWEANVRNGVEDTRSPVGSRKGDPAGIGSSGGRSFN